MNSLALQRISKGSGRKNRLQLGWGKKNAQAYSGIEVRNERLSEKFKSCLLSWIEYDQSLPVIYLEFNFVWTWLREITVERTHGTKHSEEITQSDGQRPEVRLFFKMRSTGLSEEAGLRGEAAWVTFKRHAASRGALGCSGTRIQTHTRTHTKAAGTGSEQALQQEYIILIQPSHWEPFSFLNPLFAVHH